MTELKRCPFCGGEAELALARNWYHVFCRNCHARTYLDESDTKAIESWNNRPNPWHTGTPTEDGWYLCKICTKGREYDTIKKEHGKLVSWCEMIADFEEVNDSYIVAYRKIEPYEEMEKCQHQK